MMTLGNKVKKRSDRGVLFSSELMTISPFSGFIHDHLCVDVEQTKMNQKYKISKSKK